MNRVEGRAHCCHGHSQETMNEKLLLLLEKASAVALGVLAASANIQLFASFLSLGILIGAYQYASSEPHTARAGVSSCAQGFMEQLTGIRLPRLVSLAVNLAVTWCHIDHHTTVFVPVIGVSLGAWVGHAIGQLGSRIVQRA